jgi:double-stranded uracil-DNA glycosylase
MIDGWDARGVAGLKDILPARPRALFVGINPGRRSGAVGHHFAGKGNPFWRLLHAAGLTPVLLPPEEDRRLADFGLGLTNLCPRTTPTAAELTKEEKARGARALRRKVGRVRPRAVVLVGLSVYQELFALKASGGPGPKPETLGGAPVYVVPNPSGLNASFPGFESKLVWFRALAAWLAALD